MKVFREVAYWELVRDELITVLDESGLLGEPSADEVSIDAWEMARREAITRLYLRGIFQDIGFSAV